MFAQLTPIESCQEIAGLAAHEIMLGVTPGEKHERLLARYRRARRSPAITRAKIVADIRVAVTRGARGEAADLLIVLRRLLAHASRVAPIFRQRCARRPVAVRRRLTRAPLRNR